MMAQSCVKQKLLLVALLVALSIGGAGAQSRPHPLTNIPRPLSSVSVHHVFPTPAHSHQMLIGGDTEVLLTVRNGHSSSINVTHIAGSINSPISFAVHIQNFSAIAYKAIVPANTERSFSYQFKPSPQLPSNMYQIALTAFYSDASSAAAYATTFFNKTVEFAEPLQFIDTETYSLLLTLAAIAGGIGYLIYRAVSSQPWFKAAFKKSKKAKKAAVASAPKDKSDYLVGTSYDLEQKKKATAEAKKAK